jgi:hypothetical protein
VHCESIQYVLSYEWMPLFVGLEESEDGGCRQGREIRRERRGGAWSPNTLGDGPWHIEKYVRVVASGGYLYTDHVGLDASQFRLSVCDRASSLNKKASWTAIIAAGNRATKIIHDRVPTVLAVIASLECGHEVNIAMTNLRSSLPRLVPWKTPAALCSEIAHDRPAKTDQQICISAV